MSRRSWTNDQLRTAVAHSFSIRAVLLALGLVPAGGNYEQVKRYIAELDIDIEHFTGMGWNKDMRYRLSTTIPVEDHLVNGSRIQSYKLKRKLFDAKLKLPACEMCGWCEQSEDGRTPVELDHINGDRYDNRIENLRILCPNCHSLQSTHRGRNKKQRLNKLTK